MADEIVAGLSRDYGVHPYGKWQGAFWRLGDPRAGRALDLLEEKRGDDGTWRVEGKWWKRPGSKGSNVEAVEWGGAANELLTEQATRVLRAAGRAR